MPMTIGLSKRLVHSQREGRLDGNTTEKCVVVNVTFAIGSGTFASGNQQTISQIEVSADEARAYAKMLIEAADCIKENTCHDDSEATEKGEKKIKREVERLREVLASISLSGNDNTAPAHVVRDGMAKRAREALRSE